MSRIKYPEAWIGEASEGLVVDYAELTSLCAANGLHGGNMAYIAEQMRQACFGAIDRILSDRNPTQQSNNKEQV